MFKKDGEDSFTTVQDENNQPKVSNVTATQSNKVIVLIELNNTFILNS